tara:strand:- start:3702 stop:3893 length:192 start_codon:yes stop_codon:yes gene_type:complete
MAKLKTILEALPREVTCEDGETFVKWGDYLGVTILRDGSVGQFGVAGQWTRREVESAVRELIG